MESQQLVCFGACKCSRLKKYVCDHITPFMAAMAVFCMGFLLCLRLLPEQVQSNSLPCSDTVLL